MWKLKMVTVLLLVELLNYEIAVGEMFTAQVELEGLTTLRKAVSDGIQNYLKKEEIRLEEIRNKFKGSTGLGMIHKGCEKDEMKDSFSNPLDAFLVIKGLSMDLADLLVTALDKSNTKELSNLMQNLDENSRFPTYEDIKGAATALTRLQDTYKLKTDLLAEGCINSQHCTVKLSVDDCFEIGKQNYQSRNYPYAISWMTAALNKLDQHEELLRGLSFNNLTNSSMEMGISRDSKLRSSQQGLSKTVVSKVKRSEILEYLNWAEQIDKTMQIGKNFLAEMTGIELDSFIDEIAKMAQGQEVDEDEKSYGEMLQTYESLCRGEFMDQSSKDPELKCTYSNRSNPYYFIGPIKQEQISRDPEMWKFYQVLYDSEISVIKGLAIPNFKTATVVNTATGQSEHSQARVSKSAWLIDEDHAVVEKVNQRIGSITGLNMETAEELQVANYGIGGMYLPHFDFAHTAPSANFLGQGDGNRIATLMFYMSNVEGGGATVFPSLKLSIWPEKGSAVFWYNLKSEGTGNFKTKHAACPVLIGSKWVSNKWIHERGQEFLRPCKAKPN